MKFCSLFTVALLATTMAFAQSSGSFNWTDTPLKCILDSSTGALSGGAAGLTLLKTTMKTSSGNGNAFVIRPSAVVGLLTDVTVSSKQGGSTVSSSAQAGVDFKVTVTPLSGQPAPTVTPAGPVTYADRFIQISTNLFNAIAAACLANPDGSGGCFITFNESTLDAHSFDWVATGLSSGNYGLEVDWSSSTANSGISTSATCVGPVNFTVQQVKIFTPSTGISF